MAPTDSLKLVVVLIAAVALGCTEETLSVGDTRCTNVSCVPHELETLEDESEQSFELRRKLERAPLQGMSTRQPCPFEADCFTIVQDAELIEREGGPFLLRAAYVMSTEPVEARQEGLWMGRYAGGTLEGESFIAGAGIVPLDALVQLAVARCEESPEEGIVLLDALASSRRGTTEHTLRAYRYDAEDRVELLFEDSAPAWLHDAACIGNDIVVLGTLDSGTPELTRYEMDGEIVFRQPALRSSYRELYASFDTQGLAEVRVIDDERIAALVPLRHHYEVTLLDGKGRAQWSALASPSGVYGSFFAARLAIDPQGSVVVGMDGYALNRFTEESDTLRRRKAFQTPQTAFGSTLFGLAIGPSETVYLATTDPNDASILTIERVASDLRSVEGYRLEVAEPQGCAGTPSFDSRLVVDPAERSAFISTLDCVTEFPLPLPPTGATGDF